MPTELEKRRDVLTGSRRAIQRRAADSLRFLETAPAWYRPGRPRDTRSRSVLGWFDLEPGNSIIN